MEVKELWKPLLEYKGIEVSSIGRIRKAANKRRKERILTEFPKDRDGYCRCSVQKLDGTWTSQPVHRLVAKAFIPNPYKLPEVNHKDCNKYKCTQNTLIVYAGRKMIFIDMFSTNYDAIYNMLVSKKVKFAAKSNCKRK